MSALLLGLTGLLALGAFLLRPKAVLFLLTAVVLLVPGQLPVPGAPGVVTVHRLVMAAALAGVVRRCLIGELPRSLLRPPALAWRLALVLGLFAVLGVGLLQPATDASAAARNWQALALQLPFLLTWLFLLRACDDVSAGVAALVVVTGISCVIALLEAATGASFARLWFHAAPDLLASDPAQVLATRGGKVRVRAAADFTLAFAWVTAAMVPLLLALAALRRRAAPVLVVVLLPLLVLAVVLTYSRSVVLPLIAAVVVLAGVLRSRPVRAAVVALVLGAVLVATAGPGLTAQFTTAVDTGSIDVRVDRLPVVGALAAAHPWTGLGISGLASQGIGVTDTSYLLTYAEVGVLGLAALLAVLLAVLGECLAGARSHVPADRLSALGAGVGAALLLVGTFTFDAFSVPTAAEVFWLLAAIGVAAQDGLPQRARIGLAQRAGAVALAVVVGAGLRLAAPTHVAQTWQFESLAPYPATVAAASYTGTELRSTFCALAERAAGGPGFLCQALGEAPGQGLLRLQGQDRSAVDAARQRVLAAAGGSRQLSRVVLQSRGPAEQGTATGLRTAMGWLPLLAFVLVLPVPGRPRP